MWYQENKMAETNDRKVLKMSLICSICVQRLTKPRSLPCFHTFCESCLKNYLINSPDKSNAAKNGIPCPSCNIKTLAPKPKLPVSDWAENFPVNHLVGTLIDIVPVSSRLEFCEPCKDSKVSKVAKSWCQQCSEALCDECTQCHKSMKATRNHEITGLDQVRSNPQPAIKEEIKEDVKCQEHIKKNIDMFCQDHEQPCCAMCIATHHRKCNKICEIDDVVKDGNLLGKRPPFKEMDKLVKEAESMKKERQEVLRSAMAQKTKLFQKIAETKKKLIDHIDKLESQLVTKLNAITETDLSTIHDQIEFCNSVQSAMDKTKTVILSTKDQKQEKKEFIVSSLGRKKYEECESGLRDVKENCAKILYVFEEDPQVAVTLKNLTMLGKLDLKHNFPNRKQSKTYPEPCMAGTPKTTPRSVSQISFQSPRQQQSQQSVSQSSSVIHVPPISEVSQLYEQPESSEEPITLINASSEQAHAEACPALPSIVEEKKGTRRVKGIKVKLKGDRRECRITGIKLWNDNKLLIADNANLKLKLFNESGDKVCTYDCSNPPWDFTFIDKNKFALTTPNERKIKIFRLRDGASIKEVSWVNAARGCHGITMAGDDLAVTYGTGCIRIISLDGSVRMMVDTDYIGKRVFSNPEYIAFNPFCSQLYVSDYNNHTVTALQFENGMVNRTPAFVYRVSGPRGVTVDVTGKLYVCGFWSNDIHKISDSGEFKQILKDALARPLCLAFNGDGDTMALSEQDIPNTVKLYRITTINEAD